MNWDAIGAVGEILGALAVVGTLAYLATQMKQNSASLRRANEYAQASSIHETNALFTHVFAPLVENAEMATIYTKALDGEVLDKVETTRFATFIQMYLAWAEDVFYQQETELGFAAHLDTADFFNAIGPYIRELTSTQAGQTWWETEANRHFTPPFLEALTRYLDSAR